MFRTISVWLLLFCCSCCLSLSAAEDDALLGYWKFDEGQGDVAVDSSPNGNDGDIWDAQWVRGRFGTALHFDGTGAHVTIPQLPDLDGAEHLSVEAWVYWEGTGRYPNILTGGTWSPGGFMLFVRDRQCTFRMGRPGVSAVQTHDEWREVGASVLNPFAEKRWYHIAATFARPKITTYVDGREVASAVWDFPVGYAGDLVIGQWAGTVGHEGLIDEVKIYGRTLRAAEVLASYRREAPRRTEVPKTELAYTRIPPTADTTAAVAVLENASAKFVVNRRGRGTALIDKRSGKNCLRRSSPLVTVTRGGRAYTRATCSFERDRLTFQFDKVKATVVVRVKVAPQYFTFHVDAIKAPDIDGVTLLHLNMEPCKYTHTMSGLAANDDFGVCLRSLDPRTDVRISGKPPICAAVVSSDEGFAKAAVALVACPTPEIRHALQDVVRNEGLPYSRLGGPFALDAKENRSSYVFARVSEANVEQWIELARRGGIGCIHFSGWQESLGHYAPRKTLFPHGIEGLKHVVDKIHAAGLKAGMHTLTGCISPHDPWVTPTPHPGLATDGTYRLAADLQPKDANVPTVEMPAEHPTIWAYGSRGNCIRIDDELIQYTVLERGASRGFYKCRRGAFGTRATAHQRGAKVEHMFVRYGCFVPDENASLVEDIAAAIADVYNTCGFDQIYMDGAEAMRGAYGIGRMRRAIFTRLKRPALVEASCWDHQSWPFHSRIGAWDHPKWGLKRFADDHLSAIDQYRKGALLEAQLGWWVILGPARDWNMEMPDEIEYLCAKALGYDVPLSFQNVTVTGTPPNARQNEYFTMIGRYERLRLANYFSDQVKQKLRQARQEFHLEQAPDGQWQFIPTDYLGHKVTGMHDASRQWVITNRHVTQPIKLRIEGLYSALPYADSEHITLADFSRRDEFTPGGAAGNVQYAFDTVAQPRKEGNTSGVLTATNGTRSPVGAWARITKTFDPVINMTSYDAIGLWVHGDGKGELLNIQLTNLPEYFRTLDDHYIKVDFTGWRYFELLMRERDATAYHDYTWPYGAHTVLHRSPLVRQAISKMTVYLNNLPPGRQVECYLGPIRALHTKKTVLHNPTIELNGKRLIFPVAVESGQYIEFWSADDCRLYDEHGKLLRKFQPNGDVPLLSPGPNRVTFSCTGTANVRCRAELTVITTGDPLRGRATHGKIGSRSRVTGPHLAW